MTPSRFSRGAPSDLPDKAERRSTARHAWREKKRSHTTAPRNAPGGEARLHERHVAGVVSSVQKTRCSLCCGGEDIWCSWTQRVLSEAVDAPVVGDRATAGVLADGTGVLTEIEPRRTKLARMRLLGASRLEPIGEEHVLAANVDLAVIVASVASPPFHPRLIDRYLVLCHHGGIGPLVCLNKADLPAARPELTIWTRAGVRVIFTSAVTGEGLDELRSLLRGKASVLTGHSGVGKSSLMNALAGEDRAPTAEVSEAHDRGRHRTTASCLINLGEQTVIIDTPGIRSLSVWSVDRDTIRLYFPEFAEVSLACRFNDCLHVTEPDCGVRTGVDAGEVARERYESYLRMLE